MNVTRSQEELALSVFRQPPHRYNCAQAVVYAHRSENPDCALSVEDCAGMGAGRAPEGLCGSLWAACTLRPEASAEIREAFKAQAGSITCHEIKREHGYPCPECVRLATRLAAHGSA